MSYSIYNTTISKRYKDNNTIVITVTNYNNDALIAMNINTTSKTVDLTHATKSGADLWMDHSKIVMDMVRYLVMNKKHSSITMIPEIILQTAAAEIELDLYGPKMHNPNKDVDNPTMQNNDNHNEIYSGDIWDQMYKGSGDVYDKSYKSWNTWHKK